VIVRVVCVWIVEVGCEEGCCMFCEVEVVPELVEEPRVRDRVVGF
jgi:hypothetical protein